MKLEGLRVLDLSRFLPGPYMSLVMADHGAEVIKVESFEGEPTRKLGPQLEGFSVYFRNTQRGKLSLRVDLKQSEGKDIFLRLADDADVIIDSFRPGVVEKLGIDYQTVKCRNPGIVYCSLSAFGQTSSLAQRPSHDLGGQALTGVLSLSQQGNDAPVIPSIPVADVALGSLALAGVMMALYRRTKTGAGDFLDMTMIGSLMSWNPHIISDVIVKGESPALAEERLYGGAALYNIYTTSDDRYIVLSGAEEKFAENLLTALGRPDLIDLCRQPWGEKQDPVKEFLRTSFVTKTQQEWVEWLEGIGVCYAPVLDLHESWNQPYMREVGIIETGSDGIDRLGTAVRFSGEPGRPSDKLSTVGEDTDDLLKSLGFSAGERSSLYKSGVC